MMAAWDGEVNDIDGLLNDIVAGVLHHPAQRDMGNDRVREGRRMMFESIREWWEQKDDREKDDLRRKLSREGVKEGPYNMTPICQFLLGSNPACRPEPQGGRP